MVHWSSFAIIALAMPWAVQAVEQNQQILINNKKKDSLEHAHKLLRHHPLIDTHNDLPM